MDKTQTLNEWIREHGSVANILIKEGQKDISIGEYLRKKIDDSFDEYTIGDLEEDFRYLKLNELNFAQPSKKKKWSALFPPALFEKDDGVEETKHDEVEPQVEQVAGQGQKHYDGSSSRNQSPERERYERDMVTFNREVQLIVRYCQSGKTAIIIKGIYDFHEKYKNSNIISLAIVIVDNSLMLAGQTKLRLDDCEHLVAIQKKQLGLRISSARKDPGENYKSGADPEPLEYVRKAAKNTYFYCGHSTKIKTDGDISKVLEELGRDPRYIFRVSVWIDEADKVMRNRKRSLEKWLESRASDGNLLIEQLKFITATPCDVTDSWAKVRTWVGKDLPDGVDMILEPIDGPLHGENYHLASNSNFYEHSKEMQYNPDEDVESSRIRNYILTYFSKRVPVAGELWLVPGANDCPSHEEAADVCYEINPETGEPYFTDVLLINSKVRGFRSLKIKSHDKKGWDVVLLKDLGSDSKEINEIITNYINSLGGGRRVVIIGRKCLGRGVTFSSKTYSISVGLFGPYCGKEVVEKYQLFNRLAGYTYSPGKVPTLVCCKEDYESVIKYEKILQGFFELAQNPDPEVRKLTDEKVKSIFNKVKDEPKLKYVSISEVFETLENLRTFEKKLTKEGILPNTGKGSGPAGKKSWPKAVEEVVGSGFYMCNIASEGVPTKVWSLAEVKKYWKTGINEGTKKRLIWCYKDLEDVTSLCFVLAYWNPPRED
jgi:hypothetical protein